jgi:AGZA family xanthine/uracil permease-like MFS transporter
LGRLLVVDSIAASIGGLFGASSVTSYIESAAGVAAGGRTGLTSLVVAGCFALALFFAPLAGMVPPEATAAALVIVGYLMCTLVREIPFAELEEGFPALLTVSLMPLTYSITNGIGAGFIAYVFIKLARGKAGDVHPMMYATAAAFVLYFIAH